MKLLIDARPLTDIASGGVARLSRHLVSAYAQVFPDDELILATTGSVKPDLPETLQRPNVRHLHLSVPNKLWSASSAIGAVSFTKEFEKRAGKVDATFLPNLGFVGTLKKPTSLLLHDLSFLIEPRWFNWKQRAWHRAVRAKKLIKNVDQLFAVSKRTKQDAINILGIPEERITVIPIGPTLSVIPEEAGIQHQGRYVLALGWNDRRKNARTAELAVEILRRDPAFADLNIIIVGRDVIRPNDAQLSSLFANASAFLYPSWYEGYGFPLWEAAQFGTPRVASTSGSLPETAPAGTFFAHPAKPHQWVEALRNALIQERKPVITDSTWESAARTLRRSIAR
ncbi:glycosyltransferase [Patescibacteria group bacterium]|jgi:glycosyltransferase involved in cell wall biosynthesis|nr:glycosyltransferase [Patescibacteria group bacterium]